MYTRCEQFILRFTFPQPNLTILLYSSPLIFASLPLPHVVGVLFFLSSMSRQQCQQTAKISAMEAEIRGLKEEVAQNRRMAHNPPGQSTGLQFPLIKTLEEYEDVENHPTNLVSFSLIYAILLMRFHPKLLLIKMR